MNEFVDLESLLREPVTETYTGEAPRALARVDMKGAEPARGAPLVNGINYSHAAMIDLILARPGITQNEIAVHFGYTASWVSQVMVSDAFQTALAKRREEIVDPLLRADVKKNFEALVLRSQEILMEKLSLPAHQVPDQLALRALELSSRAAGYGAREAGPQVTVNVETHLESLGANLERLLSKKRELVEGSVIDAGEDD